MTVGFYSGSFDPFTNGHLMLTKNAALLFDKVIVCIITNPSKKKRTFPKKTMKKAMEEVFKRENLNNVEVIIYDGCVTKIALDYGATYFVRGTRNEKDFRYEEKLAMINKKLIGIDTIYFRSGNSSSTKVRELLKNGKDVSKYVPKEVLKVIKK